MGLVKNQSGWSVVLTYLGIIIGFINIGYLFPKVVSAEHFGLRSVLVEMSILFGYLSTFGLSGAIQKFFYVFSRKGIEKRNSFNTLVLTQLVVGLILVLSIIKLNENYIIEFYTEKSPLFIDYLYLIYPLVIIVAVNLCFENLLIANNESKVSFFVKEVLIRILFLGIVLLLLFNLISFSEIIK